MPDDWELQYHLNPLDPDDAKADADGDGFTNLEEYRYGTNPRDPNSYPPPMIKLSVREIKPIAFRLVFKAVSHMESNLLFQINLRTGGRTYWARLGESVEGFKVVDYDGRDEKAPVLTLEHGDKRVRLLKNQEVPHNEYEITLFFALDGSERKVRVGSEFELKGSKYVVKDVDREGRRVLIGDVARQVDVWIGSPVPETAPARGPAKSGEG